MIGIGELLIIASLFLLLFGGKRLPEFARRLVHGLQEAKKAPKEQKEAETSCIETKCCSKDHE